MRDVDVVELALVDVAALGIDAAGLAGSVAAVVLVLPKRRIVAEVVPEANVMVWASVVEPLFP